MVARIMIRRLKARGKVYEYTLFRDLNEWVEVLKLRCPKDLVVEMFSKLGPPGSWADIKVGRAEGLLVWDSLLFKRALILASLYNCTRTKLDVDKVLEVVSGLEGQLVDYWYTQIINNYSPISYHGICRVVSAFRTLYGF